MSDIISTKELHVTLHSHIRAISSRQLQTRLCSGFVGFAGKYLTGKDTSAIRVVQTYHITVQPQVEALDVEMITNRAELENVLDNAEI